VLIILYAKTHRQPAASPCQLESWMMMMGLICLSWPFSYLQTTNKRRQQKSHNTCTLWFWAAVWLADALNFLVMRTGRMSNHFITRPPKASRTANISCQHMLTFMPYTYVCVLDVLCATPTLRIRKFVWPQIKINALSMPKKLLRNICTFPRLRHSSSQSRIFSLIWLPA